MGNERQNANPVHEILFTRDPQEVQAAARALVGPVLASGGAAFIALDQPHLNEVKRWVKREKIISPKDPRCVFKRATPIVRSMQKHGRLSGTRFREHVRPILQKMAAAGNGDVVVLAQVASILWRRQDLQSALAYEREWHHTVLELGYRLLCVYPMEDPEGEALEAHTGVYTPVVGP